MENTNLKNWINNRWFLWSIICLSSFVINVNYQGWNVSSRLATIQSIVEHGSLTIEKSIFNNTGDKVYINGEFYSDKPPVPSYLGTFVYCLLYHSGLSFSDNPVVTYYLIVFILIKGLYIFGLYAFYKSMDLTSISACNKNLIIISLAFGSLLFTWSSTFNNHIIAASAIMIGFYYYLKYSYIQGKVIYISVSAIFLALAGNSDIPMMMVYVIFGLLILSKVRTDIFIMYYFIPGIVVSMPTSITNLYIHGSIMPLQLIGEYFIYEGSPWVDNAEEKLSGISANNLLYIFIYGIKILFGERGFLLYTPVLLISIPCIYSIIRKKDQFYLEAIAISITSIIILLYYLIYTSNYGGWSYGIRWLVPLLPLLIFFNYRYFIEAGSGKVEIYQYLTVTGILVSLIGIYDPWTDITNIDNPFIANLIQIVYRSINLL